MNLETSISPADQIAQLEEIDATQLVGLQTWNALTDIEVFSEDWVIHGVPRTHSFGRLPDEEEIRAWPIPRTTGYVLFLLLMMHNPKVVLELGTSLAYSSIWLGAALARSGGRLWTCEIFQPKIELAKKHIASSGLENINLVEGDALDTTRAWRRPIDLLFLDADPESYPSYWKYLESHMNGGSILIMDNAIDHYEITRPFCEMMRSHPDWETSIFPLDHGLLLAKKKPPA